MTKLPFRLLAPFLMLPSLALAEVLTLPDGASVEVQVIDGLQLDQDTQRQDDIAMRPMPEGNGSHQLPAFCVLIGDAMIDGERVRITTKALTCIETDDGDSEIYNGEIAASAYDSDDSYGIAACEEGRCDLGPDQGFELRLNNALAIEQQDNPSARLNEERRQVDGSGIANPVPADRPDPE
jgi:hypothetical protein